MNENSISARNLKFSYYDKPVLKNLNFEIKKNSFTSILGPNGAGKSTIVKLISKVLTGYGGEILIDGQDIKNLNQIDIAQKIAVVPQNTSIGFNFSVFETIMMGRYPYLSRFKNESQEDYKIVADVMKITRTEIFKDKNYNELSGGEKQRVIIAQTLVQNSPIIILDEPTSHLDINFQIEFMELFFSLFKNNQKTIIGIFHDINLAIQYSEKIMLLKDGDIFCYGSVEEVITRTNMMSVFNSDVFIGKNPFTGKLYVSPNFNLQFIHTKEKIKKEIKVHVIGGGGAASPILNVLHNSGYIVSTGVVNNLDSDLNTALQLGITFVNEAPFSPISKEAYLRNLELIKSSDFVILPCVEFGNGNFLNLSATLEAVHLGKKVVVINKTDVNTRDYVDGKAIQLYGEIISGNAVVIDDNDEILNILKTD
jgi:iron complex transport system ATP-binding protein